MTFPLGSLRADGAGVAAGGAAGPGAVPLRRQLWLRANADNQARPATSGSHHTEWPSMKSAKSDVQAPNWPALLRSTAPLPEVEKPGSAAL